MVWGGDLLVAVTVGADDGGGEEAVHASLLLIASCYCRSGLCVLLHCPFCPQARCNTTSSGQTTHGPTCAGAEMSATSVITTPPES